MTKDVIILARHGRPALSRKVWLTSQDYKDWWRQYDEGGLLKNQGVPKKIAKLARQADIVISSSLSRAQETAKMASGRNPDFIDPNLVEAPLPPPNLGSMKMRPIAWGTVSRILWMMGMSGGLESQKLARIRAERAADMLSETAVNGKMVYVAAHGWFNRMLRPALKRRGWVCTEDLGDAYWSYRRYERETKG